MSRLADAALEPAPVDPAPGQGNRFERVLAAVNRVLVGLGGIALLAASVVLTYSVFSRYFFKAATDWQDEAAVFCIVGAVFMASAHVQSLRGHIGIELMAAIFPPRAERVRQIVVDIATFLFCAFFAWKSWTLWHEAWVDKQTSTSTWGPPLWIPYVVMAAGMTLLALQVLLQVAAGFARKRP